MTVINLYCPFIGASVVPTSQLRTTAVSVLFVSSPETAVNLLRVWDTETRSHHFKESEISFACTSMTVRSSVLVNVTKEMIS
jgi:hypothetical protein